MSPIKTYSQSKHQCIRIGRKRSKEQLVIKISLASSLGVQDDEVIRTEILTMKLKKMQ